MPSVQLVVPRTFDDAATRRATFEAIVAEVYEPLQRYLRRRCSVDDADDLLNDVLLVLWRRLEDAPADRVLPWTYGVARRCLANHRRGNHRRLRLVERVGRASSEGRDDGWTSTVDAALQSALDGLPERDRDVVRLWAWERLEPREIATVLGTTPNAVSVRLGRIQRRLATALPDNIADIARQDGVPAGHEGDVHHEEPGG